MNRYLIIFLVVFFEFCSPYRSEQKTLLSTLQILQVSPCLQNKVVLAIPVNGCSSCIEPCIEFAQMNYTDTSVVYLFSSNMGRKSISVHFTDSILQNANILLDPQGEASRLGLIERSPVALFFDNRGDIISQVYITSDNYAQALDSISRFVLER